MALVETVKHRVFVACSADFSDPLQMSWHLYKGGHSAALKLLSHSLATLTLGHGLNASGGKWQAHILWLSVGVKFFPPGRSYTP